MIEGQEGVRWPEWVDLARACEEAGIEGLFRSDHYASFHRGSGHGALDAWATLAALAAVTRRIRIGVLVSPVTFRHPSDLSRSAVTVDHVSGGRVEVGLGAGWHEEEHRLHRFPFPPLGTRLELLEEQLEIVGRQWAEEEFDFHGRHYRLEACRAEPKPVQQPRPPLIVGGAGGPRSIRLAARFADEYNTFARTIDDVRERRDLLLETCEREGRAPIRFTLMTQIAPDTVEEVFERVSAFRDEGVDRVYLQQLAHRDLDLVRQIGERFVPAL